MHSVQFSSVQLLSCVRLCDPMHRSQASLSITISRSSLRLTCIESVMLSNHLILFCFLFLTSIFPSIRVFSSESILCIRWPKYWSFRISISPSNEHPGLISFKMDWLDLLTVQGALKSLLQSLFSSVQFSRSVVCDSLRPHELQHARPPCPSPSPGVHSDSRASSP